MNRPLSINDVPVLRFPGFSASWVYSPMGATYPKIRNGFVGTATPYYAKSGNRYIQGKDIKNGRIQNTVNVFVSDEFRQKNTASILKQNDIVMVQSGHVGECAVVTAEFDSANCHALIIMSPERLVDSRFFVYYFYSWNGRKKIQRFKTGNTIEHILASDMKKILVPEVGYEEQRGIADFLSKVDEKISALQAKKKQLQKYKKGATRLIFSQNPRFGSSSVAAGWDKKTLGDVFVRITSKNKENNKNVLTISAQQGLVNQESYFNRAVAAKDLSGYYLLGKGDFAYNKSYSSGYPMGAIKRLTKYEKGVVSSLYICFRAKAGYSEDFLEQYFNAGLQNKFIEKVAQEGARNHGLLNIGVEDFFNIELCIPDYEEQQRIANFLQSLDDKIELAEKELEQAKAFKKALLQQMFV